MNPKLLCLIPAAGLLLVASLTALAQPGMPAPGQIDPQTGLPIGSGQIVTPSGGVNPATGLPVPGHGPRYIVPPGATPPTPTLAASFDPLTGLPHNSEPQWIDPNWTEPSQVLTNVDYDGRPLSQVTQELRGRFKNSFDILPLPQWGSQDWGSLPIHLELRNVHASEVFNAMNLVFDNDRTPVRWELKSPPGARPWIQLRVLPQGAPADEFSATTQPRLRQIFYVGDLAGDEKNGGMTMDQIVRTVTDVLHTGYPEAENIVQFHTQAQLLIASGTRDQNQFLQQTLNALRQKVSTDRDAKRALLRDQMLREPKNDNQNSR